MTASSGRFLTLEGVDGAGKSTHVAWLLAHLRERGLDVISTREPGGCELAERLRDLLLTHSMTLQTETLLMFAARSEHLQQTIRPALASGAWVVCDRFTDATYAYQGGGRELGASAISTLEQWVHPDLTPHRTWLFDVPLDVARARLADSRVPDRFEQENAAFFERTRAAYHARAAADSKRFMILDGTQSIDTLRAQLAADIDGMLMDTA